MSEYSIIDNEKFTKIVRKIATNTVNPRLLELEKSATCAQNFSSRTGERLNNLEDEIIAINARFADLEKQIPHLQARVHWHPILNRPSRGSSCIGDFWSTKDDQQLGVEIGSFIDQMARHFGRSSSGILARLKTILYK